MPAGLGVQNRERPAMSIKRRHLVSFSSFPKRLSDARGQATHLTLKWDNSSLKERVLFVLNLICEQASGVHVQFVDSVESGALNWQFRGKDHPTDVLSFVPHVSSRDIDLGSSKQRGASAVNLGDLAICVDVCAEQAKRHRCSLAAEVERMLVHGLLHLKGFDHERSDAAHTVMTALEKSIRLELKRAFGEAEFCREVSKKPAATQRGVRR